uniref:Reverse transcriptase domain-containing protein n=1 Tax=Trichogramma kaykai TaxID=54128 RepID=A0ABD2WYE8_9HYME
MKAIISEDIELLEFADDLVIYIKSQNIREVVSKIEKEVNKLYNKLSDKNFFLAPKKCQLIIFSQNTPRNSNYSLKINNNKLKPKNNVKFLGIHLDKNLNWSHHIKKTKESCLKALNIIKCLRGVYWGADPSTLLMLNESIILSKIEYGGFIVSPIKETKLYELQKIQNTALRLCLRYTNSTPINVMHAEAKIPMLDSKLDYLCSRYLLQCLSIHNHSVIRSIEILTNTANTTIYEHNFNKSRTISTFEECEFYNGQILQYNNYHRIFSDSRSNLEALNKIHGLQNKPPLVKKIKLKLIELADKDVKVEIFWLLAHIGLQGNENADTNAKKAAAKDISFNLDIPVSDIFAKFKYLCKEKDVTHIKEIGETKGTLYF